MKLIIERQKIYARHGVLPQEQMVGAYYYVSIEAETSHTKSIETDQLSDTISYADMAQAISEEMTTSSKLLEHAAGRIAHRLLSDFPLIDRIKVKLIKENPPMGVECQGAGVEVEFDNNNR